VEVVDNVELGRFEMAVGDEVAFLKYRRFKNQLDLVHTEVPTALRGRGVATRLVRAVLDKARAEGASIIPTCPFVKAFVEKHPEYRSLVSAPRSR
jgi:predicted GNAT family acetyltransferase